MNRSITALLFCVATLLPAATPTQSKITSGSAIFIDPMPDGLDGFLRAEIIKQKVAVRIVLSAEDADVVMTGSSVEHERKWAEGWLTPEKDHVEGNVLIVDRKAKTVIWADEAGDRSIFWGALKRGGGRKVAERIVSDMKKLVK